MAEMPQSSTGRASPGEAAADRATPGNTSARWAWVLLAILLGLVYLRASAPVTTGDLFWHVKTGEHLVEVGGFPKQDPFSYTAGHLDWHLHEWLTQVALYGLYELGGFPALQLITGLMAVGILLMFFDLARRQIGHPLPAILVLMAFALLATTRFQTRPPLFSMALFLFLVSWLLGHRGPWRLPHGAGLVALVLLWVNLHSVGLLALLVYGAYLLAMTLKWFLQWQGPVPGWEDAEGGNLVRHGLTFAAAVGVSVFNPSGFGLYAFALQDSSRLMDHVTDERGPFRLDYGANESLSPEAYGTVLLAMIAMLAVGVLAGVALNKARDRLRSPSMPDPVAVALALVCLGVGLMARRFHWMVAVSLVPVLGILVNQLRAGTFAALGRALGSRPAVGLGTAATVAMLGLLYNRELRYEGELLHRAATRADFYQRQIAPSLELPAIRFLAETGLEGSIFCHYDSGGMLSFYLYPRIGVFIDSRIDLYRREIFLDYLAIRDGRPDQVELLDRYDTDIFFRHRDIAPLVDPEGWIPIYRGVDGELWLRAGRGWRNLERCAAYYAERGIPFDRTAGLN